MMKARDPWTIAATSWAGWLAGALAGAVVLRHSDGETAVDSKSAAKDGRGGEAVMGMKVSPYGLVEFVSLRTNEGFYCRDQDCAVIQGKLSWMWCKCKLWEVEKESRNYACSGEKRVAGSDGWEKKKLQITQHLSNPTTSYL